MRLRSIFLLLVLVAIGGFAVLNWTVFMAPTSLSLGLMDVQAPLGLIMLGVLVGVVALFMMYVLYLQTTVLLDARSHAKELQLNRKLADQAEASRFTELRTYLDAAFTFQATEDKAAHAALLAKIEKLDADLKLTIEQSGNSLAAIVAEMDDRLCAVGSGR